MMGWRELIESTHRSEIQGPAYTKLNSNSAYTNCSLICKWEKRQGKQDADHTEVNSKAVEQTTACHKF